MPIVALENNINIITPSQYLQQVQESPVREGASVSEVIERPASEGVKKKSNSNKFCFPQQSSNLLSRMIVEQNKIYLNLIFF